MIVAQRQQTNEAGPRRMLNEKQVLEIIPISRTTLYRMEKAGRFPKSTYISPNRRVWYEDEIVAWQKRLMNSIRIGRGARDVACVRLLQLGANRTGADGYNLVRPAILPCATTSNTTMLNDMDAVAAELERAPMIVLDAFQHQFACISICRLTRPRIFRGEACASCRPARDRTRACASLKATGTYS